jgi:hypothetical protein
VPDALVRLPLASGRAAIIVDGSAAADATAATWDSAVAVAQWLIARFVGPPSEVSR